MLRRDDRQERREERGPGGGSGATHYQMRQKMFAIGDDFWIENDRGEKVYKVDGKSLRVRSTLILEDRNGHEVAKIQERMLRVKESMEIEDADGRKVGMVKKAILSSMPTAQRQARRTAILSLEPGRRPTASRSPRAPTSWRPVTWGLWTSNT